MKNNYQNPELILLDKGPFQSLKGDDTRDLITAIKRIVYASVESAWIIDNLPNEITDE